jgi:hypothetical protein
MKNNVLRYLVPVAVIALLGCQRNPPAGQEAEQSRNETPATETRSVAKPAPQRNLEVPAGAVLRVRLDHSVDTEHHQPGDAFTATLDEPVMAGARVAIPKGAQFTGRVTGAKSSGRLRGRGYLSLTLDSFESAGRTYQVSTTTISRATGDHKKRNAALIGGGAGLGAVVGAIAGGGKGAAIGAATGAAAGTAGAAATGKKNVVFPAETLLQFEIKEPVRLAG